MEKRLVWMQLQRNRSRLAVMFFSNKCTFFRKKMWRTETIPRTWEKAIIIPIFKKGNNRECQNECGISLLLISGKVFMKVIQSCLQKHREQTNRKEQASFRSHRGSCDQMFSICQVRSKFYVGNGRSSSLLTFSLHSTASIGQHFG